LCYTPRQLGFRNSSGVYSPTQALQDDMRPSMTRECDERMWNLAYSLAQSGEHRNCQAIEWELQALGHSRARQLLRPERVREKLDGMCTEARIRIRKCLRVPELVELI
jgi:hypothetical protein